MDYSTNSVFNKNFNKLYKKDKITEISDDFYSNNPDFCADEVDGANSSDDGIKKPTVWGEKHDFEIVSVDGYLAKKGNIFNKRTHQSLKVGIGWLLIEFDGHHNVDIVATNSVNTDADSWRKYFASRINKDYLKLVLLKSHGYWQNNIHGTVYELNYENVDKLIAHMGVSYQDCIDAYCGSEVDRLIAKEDYAEQYSTGNIKYGTVHYRDYNELSRTKKKVRNEFLHHFGYTFAYDVKSAFPTILYHHFKTKYGIDFPFMKQLVESPDLMRVKLGAAIGEDEIGKVKLCVNAMFFGSRPTTTIKNSLYKTLGFDEIKFKKMQNSDLWNKLINEVNTMRDLIAPDTTNKQKNNSLYFIGEAGEKEIRDLLSDLFVKNGGRVYTLHDCIFSDIDLDVNFLQAEIKFDLGMSVKLSKETI